ncbi:MAG: mechanosensitive ion channel family protein [Treponema sp.]|nr:mechanosensitive ion channel family protein [Treponema sp.]MCL2251858.1 mechanosensitive ion channel family protein [Treponema sp.]
MVQQLSNFWEINSNVILSLLKNIGISAVIIIIGVLLSKGLQKLIRKSNSERLPKEGRIRPLFKAMVRYGILIICAIMILNVFGVNTTSLLAVLGAAGIAIGLALKDTLGNIASGIILLILGPFHIDEFVEFGSYSGIVKEINLFTTILETPDGVFISAPNSCIWGNPVKNYTRNGKRRMEISIGIAYSDSVDKAFQVMQDLITAEPRFLHEPAPFVILQSIESSSVKITIRAWTAVENYWIVYWEMNKNVKRKIEEAGLHIPLPQREVRIVNESI